MNKDTLVRALRLLLYVVLTAGALTALFGLFARKDYFIERQTTIAAPITLVYDQVRYFRNFRVWSPWAGMDAAIRIEGPDGTPGAMYYWMGEGEVGVGQMKLKALGPRRIDFEVTIDKPYEAISPTWFTFEADSLQTTVRWVYHMHIGYPWNGLAMFTDVDAGVGKDLSRGLENLKRHCEAMMPRTYNGYVVREEERSEQPYLGFRQRVPLAEVEAFLREHFERLDLLVRKRSLIPTGPKVALFWTIDSLTQEADIAAAVPTLAGQKVLGGLQPFTLEAGQTYWVEQMGMLDLGAAQKALALYLDEAGLVPLPPLQVEYLRRPPEVRDTAQWTTRIGYRAAAPPPPPDTLETEENREQQ